MLKYHFCPDVRLEDSLAVIAGPAFYLLSTTSTEEREKSCQDMPGQILEADPELHI